MERDGRPQCLSDERAESETRRVAGYLTQEVDLSSLVDAQNAAVQARWLDGPVTTGVYLSAGGDTQPMVLLHPQFLNQQGAGDTLAPNLLVYVDAERPGDG